MENSRQILTVSQLNTMARIMLEQLSVWVEGEIEGYEDTYRAAVYFKLKDGQSVLPCMFWKNSEVGYLPKNGEKVLIYGTLSLYEKSGRFQMMVAKIELYGEGELLKKREELRKKLQAEGLFAEEIKRSIPALPLKIGLITSKRGAAIEDFKTNVVKGFSGLEISFVDALVQGDLAVKSICDAFKRISREKLDVVVVTRGGGDSDDLMCFNSEEVVRAVRACPMPVISAVGHEIDVTLCDLAADLRVSTPTKAAEVISAAYVNYKSELGNAGSMLEYSFTRKLQNLMQELDSYELSLRRTGNSFTALPAELGDLKKRLMHSVERSFVNLELNLRASLEKLDALSPTKVLKRGYSIAQTEAGEVVKSLAQVSVNDTLQVLLSDGQLKAVVKEKHL